MTKDLPAVVDRFEINKNMGDGVAIARLPTLGMREAMAFSPDMGKGGVEAYVAALHMAIGDTRTEIEGSIIEAAKALGATPPQAQAYARMAFMPDPANYGLMQWPGMQPESIRKVTRDNLLPQMIIRSRVNDLRRYSALSTHSWSPGWRVVMRDATEIPTRQDMDDIREAEKYVWNCSRDVFNNDPRERDANLISQFERFLCQAGDDSLTFDGWAVWTDKDRANRIRTFCNLPAGLVRLAVPGRGYKGDPSLFAALVDETGSPVAAFTRDEMTWSIRNERLDPSVAGYGWSESEMAIRTIQGYQNAIDLNVDTFQRNSIPNALLKLKGDFWQQEQVDALMREWTNMKRGISKSWGMPVVSIPDDGDIELMNFMDMKGEDVRYKDHMNMMVGVYCIIAQYPIRKLGLFASGNHRDNQVQPNESLEVQGVDDPGLPAFLTFFENRYNEYFLQPNWPRLRLMFMAKNPKEDARAYEARKLARTWRESRAEVDQPELSKDAPDWIKPVLEIMDYCPEDPAKMGAFQTLAQVALEKKLGVGADGGGNEAGKPGAPFPSKTDPAKSQEHGHRAGVRRNGARERAAAGSEAT